MYSINYSKQLLVIEWKLTIDYYTLFMIYRVYCSEVYSIQAKQSTAIGSLVFLFHLSFSNENHSLIKASLSSHLKAVSLYYLPKPFVKHIRSNAIYLTN